MLAVLLADDGGRVCPVEWGPVDTSPRIRMEGSGLCSWACHPVAWCPTRCPPLKTRRWQGLLWGLVEWQDEAGVTCCLSWVDRQLSLQGTGGPGNLLGLKEVLLPGGRGCLRLSIPAFDVLPRRANIDQPAGTQKGLALKTAPAAWSGRRSPPGLSPEGNARFLPVCCE